MKRSIPTQLFVAAFVLLVLACSDELNKNNELNNSTAPAERIVRQPFNPPNGIDFNGDYLIIPTPKLFDETMKALKASDPESVSKWTTKLGLISMRDIYIQALKEQDDYLQKLQKVYESLPPNDKRLKVRPIIPQTSFVAEHAGLFDFDDYGAIRHLKVSNPTMERLLNKNGIIMVAGHIFQYNENNIKIIIGGDDRKIKVLPTIETSNEKLNIVVNPVTHEYKGANNEKGRIWYTYNSSKNVGTDMNYLYYFNYSIHMSFRVDPVYDTTPVCDPPGCGQARTSNAQDCYCYYPIIGYTEYTLHEASMECRKVWNTVIDTQHHSTQNSIDAHITSNVYGPVHYYDTNYDFVNMTLTIYDGQSNGLDFSYGDYTFYEKANTPGILLTDTAYHQWSD